MGNFATASRRESDPFPPPRSRGVQRDPWGPRSQNRRRPRGWELESQIRRHPGARAVLVARCGVATSRVTNLIKAVMIRGGRGRNLNLNTLKISKMTVTNRRPVTRLLRMSACSLASLSSTSSLSSIPHVPVLEKTVPHK